MTGVLSFLGGNVFRMILGEIFSYFTKKQDHEQELDRLNLQERIDQAKHDRQKDLIKMQSDLNIKEIQVVGDVALEKSAADAFLEAVKATSVKTGIPFVDGWNAVIRPSGASLALIMMVVEIIAAGFVIPTTTADVFYAFLGIYVADRNLSKRGK